MLKKVKLLFLLILLSYWAQAQAPYGNEWIKPSQTYYKIQTAKDGMYAVLSNQIPQAVGVSTSNLQLWHRGVEQRILIKNDLDGTFGSGDSLIFFGQVNDGTLDTKLYIPTTSQPHTYYNLYNDTTAYFLTWGSSPSTKPRIATDPTNTVLTPEPFHIGQILKVYTDDYSHGTEYGEATQTYGDIGETWCSYKFNQGGPQVFDTLLTNMNTSGGMFTVEVMVVGRNNTYSREVTVTISNPNGLSIVDTIPVFSYFNTSVYKKSYSSSLLTSTDLSITITPLNGAVVPVQNNLISTAYIKITYPQNTDMGGFASKAFYPATTSGQTYDNINWTSSSAPVAFDLTDIDNLTALNTTLSGNNLGVFVPAGVSKFVVLQSDAYQTPPSIKTVDLTPYSATQDFIILTHSKLALETQKYATYRESVAGGSHSVLIVDVDKLYNQYSYGEYSPTGIMGFCNYQADFNPNIKNLFIIGKGVDLSYEGNGGFYRKNPSYYENLSDPTLKVQDFVPPAGSPPSDILYSMKNISGQYIPRYAVGRLSAKDITTIDNYLSKVIEHEALDSNLLWRKQLIHLSGGVDADQEALFLSYVNGYKTIVENSAFKGKVIHTYVKDLNSGEVDNVHIADDVNGGLNMLTFFGHSAYFVAELDIGNVSQPIFGYNNKGKYPMMIINGCQSGDVYMNYSMSEDWLNTKDKGAIAIMGVSDIGYTSPLDAYCSAMYHGLYDTDSLRDKPAGKVMKEVLKANPYIDYQSVMQMNFHGDPQVRMYSPTLPDYEISGDGDTRADKPMLKCFIQSFDSKTVTAATDSFKIGIPIKNFGIYKDTVFNIQVTRTVNGKETIFKEVLYPPVKFVDTVYFVINDNQGAYYGLNQFKIVVDPSSPGYPNGFIKEMKEDNNSAELNYYMSQSAVTCIFPKEYSIVHGQPVTFVAQSTNLLLQQRDYYFELDTNYLFKSGFKKTGVITSGSLVKWPNIDLYSDNNKDSIVYYWRVRFNHFAAGEDSSWGNSSFIYIKNSPDGWSQSEAPQFMNDVQSKVYMDLTDSTWKFSGVKIPILFDVKGDGDGSDLVEYTNFKVGDNNLIFPGYLYEPCDGPRLGNKVDGIFAMSLNKNTLEYNIDPNWTGYPYTCGRFPKNFLNRFYTSDPGWLAAFQAWLDDVATGDIIIVTTSGNAYFNSWPQTIKDDLKNNFGAVNINSLSDHDPYLLIAKKGSTVPVSEKYSTNPNASLHLDSTLTGTYNNGTIVSTRIGPATQWGTFYQRIYSKGQDQHLFKILGEKLDGTIDTLNINFAFAKNAENIDTLDLQPQIDVSKYPYIRLLCSVYDSSIALDPPQLNRWQVIYHKSPEGSMNPFAAGLENYTIPNKQEGAQVCIPYEFDNIGDLSFGDSLKVEITAKSGTGVILKDTTYIIDKDSLKPGQSVSFNYCLNTKGLSGNVIMRTFVNPNIQPEEYYTNNFIESYFEVIKDKIPPVIDVTFDGVHIMDGDLVSPSPLITVTLNDNSKYLLITDPNDISIFFKSPGASTPTQISTSGNKDITINGQSAGSSNTFSITYHPQDLPDGDYTIIVQGNDVNGNKSGQLYKVTFHVENASTITNFYPYPNPFSSSTRFVFTLTGKYIPDDLKIQIMTVTGKVVREITKEELGHIHIGNNKTEYAWNGTDEFGDKLANGVYLYHVIIKDKGDNFEHRDTAGDKAFKKNYGKLYILR